MEQQEEHKWKNKCLSEAELHWELRFKEEGVSACAYVHERDGRGEKGKKEKDKSYPSMFPIMFKAARDTGLQSLNPFLKAGKK